MAPFARRSRFIGCRRLKCRLPQGENAMRTFATDKDRIALIVAFAAIFGQPALKAQAPSNTVVANIPFSFQIGSSFLPAGTYNIRMQGNDLLSIKGEAGAAVMLVMRDSANRPSRDSA